MVPWKVGGGKRVVEVGFRAEGSVMRRGPWRGRERSQISAALASDSVALLVGLAW
jgi:hypothetical protein